METIINILDKYLLIIIGIVFAVGIGLWHWSEKKYAEQKRNDAMFDEVNKHAEDDDDENPKFI